ncbi:acyl-CoA thioesterase II [Sandaracinobacter sp. RS1-74]|uniref:acyl-CoA thioesterase n=1 Tax=Sandaracinobacteroides sayramensis TaxID=2913411 RepID=UPI001EDB882D|nr:acyl-CoA thioesterase II [Sandaracinobacteroides sayramensis]MCG2839701.1 acyl-CoA thioesterase II [Sandaracinobacteroides sayramensis]
MQTVREWDGVSAPELIALERLDRDLFRNHLNQSNANDALFGGQVLAQSLTAATHTVDDMGGLPRGVHSLHGYFLRAGRAHAPVIYQVDRTRDGGRFSTRRVIAIQEGEPIFHMECGFHAAEGGFEHQAALPPGIPAPSELLALPELAETMGERLPDWLRERWVHRDTHIDVKPVDPESFLRVEGVIPRRAIWMRLKSGAGATPHEQCCLLAYLSDYWLAGTAAMPHTLPCPSPSLFMASLDHAMWFHRPMRVDEWLLFDTDSPSAQAGRGMSRGLIYSGNGVLVSSVAQEALLRPRRADG